jgi:hypothetical protein
MTKTRKKIGKWKGVARKTFEDAGRALSAEIGMRGEDWCELSRLLALQKPTYDDRHNLKQLLSHYAGSLARLGFIFSELS